jgi:hypothetical protein
VENHHVVRRRASGAFQMRNLAQLVAAIDCIALEGFVRLARWLQPRAARRFSSQAIASSRVKKISVTRFGFRIAR